MKYVKFFVLFLLASLPLALLIILSIKLSTDALAVIIGLVLGILASVPASLTVAYMLIQRDRAAQKFSAQSGPGAGHQPYQPPVIVVNGGQQGHPPASLNYTQSPQADFSPDSFPTRREFTIIGEDVMAD